MVKECHGGLATGCREDSQSRGAQLGLVRDSHHEELLDVFAFGKRLGGQDHKSDVKRARVMMHASQSSTVSRSLGSEDTWSHIPSERDSDDGMEDHEEYAEGIVAEGGKRKIWSMMRSS